MEKSDKTNKNLLNKLLLAGALGVGAFTINHGSKINEIKEITSTYQGYTAEEARTSLIFDDKAKEARENFPVLVIDGNPDTLKIGEKYTVKYAIKNWNNIFPKKILNIKYAK